MLRKACISESVRYTDVIGTGKQAFSDAPCFRTCSEENGCFPVPINLLVKKAAVMESRQRRVKVDLVASDDHTGTIKSKQEDVITVYVIQSRLKKYRYVGITNDFKKRFAEHTKNKRAFAPFLVLHIETFPDYQSARFREKFLKSGQGRAYLDTL